jgi:hypothetical protein
MNRVGGDNHKKYSHVKAIIEQCQVIQSRRLPKDIFDFFQRFDYTFYKIFRKGFRPLVRYDQRLENFQYQN